jgi:hypothetical protein
MNPQQQALEAAMLARMVGSHLHGVDSMTVERSSNQANKIDMQKFVAPIVGKQVASSGPGTPVSPAMMRAIQDAERQALAEVPDPSELRSFETIPQASNVSPVVGSVNVVQQEPVKFSNEDMVAIRSQLERVNATLTKMSGMLGKVFNTFNEKNRNNQQD